MTRQETLRAISDISQLMKGSLPDIERRMLHAERRELRRSLIGWLDGDTASVADAE